METMRPNDRASRRPVAGRPLDLAGFPGTWINANPQTTGIARLEVELKDGTPSVRAIAVGPDGLLAWGTAETTGVYTFGPESPVGAGFSLRYDFGFLESLVHANLNKGLMVLSIYSRYRDGSNRPDYFIREYFAVTHSRYFHFQNAEDSGAVPLTPALRYACATDCRFDGRPVLDPGPILGRWLNTNPRSTGFAEVVIAREGERLIVRARGAGEGGAAERVTEGIVLANIEEEDKISNVALLALFDLGSMEIQMQLRFNKELLVAALFSAYREDGGRFDHFSRDFFHRAV